MPNLYAEKLLDHKHLIFLESGQIFKIRICFLWPEMSYLNKIIINKSYINITVSMTTITNF